MTSELQRTQVVRRCLEETFAFFADPQNLEEITPPWLHFRILEAPDRLGRGSLLRYRLRLYGVPVRWLTEIENRVPGGPLAPVRRVRRLVDEIFDYRAARLGELL